MTGELQVYEAGTLVDSVTFGLGGIAVYSTGRGRLAVEAVRSELTDRGITDPAVLVEALDGRRIGEQDLFAPGLVDTLEADGDAAKGHLEGAAKLKAYWVTGAGALKIKWKTDGDFKRCVRHLGKFVGDPEGLCNTYHQAAVGAPPGKGH